MRAAQAALSLRQPRGQRAAAALAYAIGLGFRMAAGAPVAPFKRASDFCAVIHSLGTENYKTRDDFALAIAHAMLEVTQGRFEYKI